MLCINLFLQNLNTEIVVIGIKSKTFPFLNEITQSFKFQIGIGVLIFLILWLFEPFELYEIKQNKTFIIIGYGFVTYLFLLIHFLQLLFP